MRLIRTIHPVGQGGFYTESIKDDSGKEFLVAYDCGGNNKQFMEDYLESFIHDSRDGGKMVIDAVFISHLHADHINGLEYLLKKVDVKYLFLPRLTNELLVETLLYNTLQNHENAQELTDFILKLYDERNGDYYETRIVQVDHSEGQGGGNQEGQNNSVDINNISQSLIESGKNITFSPDIQWLYIPYNPPANHRSTTDFYNFLKAELDLTSLDFSRIPEIVEDCSISKLKDVYKRFFGSNHNSYSMTLFSGLRDSSRYKIKGSHHVWNLDCDIQYHLHQTSANCLYTGDFEARAFNDMRLFYGHLWPTIESIQVPHHGSKNNIHPSLYDNAIRGFISVGTENKYSHPHKMTLIELYNQGCLPIVVTEDEWTKFVSYYSF
ncbi:MAG: MBL fold metallo-hydrolase [Bacteroidales bacterium]|nr:MBL fold metallo-hydrolase [Bacteroidales bacterium]